MNIIIKQPSQCSKQELKDFYDLMVQSGEVTLTGLETRIKKSYQLGFIYIDNELACIAALKNPSASYRWKITTKSNVVLLKDKFPYELGWIFTSQKHRGKNLSFILCETLLRKTSSGVFATTNDQNSAMKHILNKLKFKHVGDKYKSMKSGYIMLYVKE